MYKRGFQHIGASNASLLILAELVSHPVVALQTLEVNAWDACCRRLYCSAVPGEGERVSLGKNPVKARGSVEHWLTAVEGAMVSSLRRLAKQGMASYPEEPRADWVLRQPAQLAIAVSQVYWCEAVEAALRSGSPLQQLAAVHEVGSGVIAGDLICVGGGCEPLMMYYISNSIVNKWYHKHQGNNIIQSTKGMPVLGCLVGSLHVCVGCSKPLTGP